MASDRLYSTWVVYMHCPLGDLKSTNESAGTPLHTLAALASTPAVHDVSAGVMCIRVGILFIRLLLPYPLQCYAGTHLYNKGTGFLLLPHRTEPWSQMKPGLVYAAPLQAECVSILITFQITRCLRHYMSPCMGPVVVLVPDTQRQVLGVVPHCRTICRGLSDP